MWLVSPSAQRVARPDMVNKPKKGGCWLASQYATGYGLAMSTVDMVLEKVRSLDDAHARQLLAWLEAQETAPAASSLPLGARAMLGFARRIHPQPRRTNDWMAELRAGEAD